jgi:hypothetical protein
MKFDGFEPPFQNWVKLPNAFIEELPKLSGAEIKVLLYLIRHTWGYQEFGKLKHISQDGFANGRKLSNGGTYGRRNRF